MKRNLLLPAGRGAALVILTLGLAVAPACAEARLTPPPPVLAPAVLPATARPQTAPTAASAPPPVPGDIRDIRGPIHLPTPWIWAWWLAGGAVFAALAYGGWRWKKHRVRAAVLLPYQAALARLEQARALMQPEQAREFSILVSEIVRQFIEERFQVYAARRTTEEFLRDLLAPADALLGNHRAPLADFLMHCDLAKFARWTLSAVEMSSMLKSARHFISETGPLPPPAPVADPNPPAATVRSVPANS